MADPNEEMVARIASQAAREALKQFQHQHRDEASNIALAAAKEAVRETHAELFALLGYNIADFRDIKRLRSNLDFLNSLHANAATAGGRVMFGAITILVGAFAVALMAGIKAILGR